MTDRLADVNPLHRFVQRTIEGYYGCPLEDITRPERVAWANRNTESKLEFDAVLEAIR